MNILSRLKRLEQIRPVDGVALLMLREDGAWDLLIRGKCTTYLTIEAAKRHVRPECTLIIDDI